MKKGFSYLLMFITAAMFAVSCSSNKDHTMDNIPGTYSGNKLSVSINGKTEVVSGASVTVIGTDANNVTLKVSKAILGQEEYVFEGCQFRVDEFDARVFAGISETDCNTVAISGKVNAGKMIFVVEYDGVTGDYSQEKGSSFTLNGDKAPVGSSIQMEGVSSSDIKLVLTKMVPSDEKIEITGLEVTEVKDENVASAPQVKSAIIPKIRKVTGQYRDGNKEIAVEGRIQDGLMLMDMKVKMLGDAVGLWKAALVQDDTYGEIAKVAVEITGADDETIMGISVPEFGPWVAGLVGSLGVDYLKALQYLDFQADGNIALLVHDPLNNGQVIEIPNEMIPKGAIQWYRDGSKVVLVVTEDLINMIPGGYGEIIKGFFPVKNGYVHVALNTKMVDGRLVVYLDKDFLSRALPVVEQNLPPVILIDPNDPESDIRPLVDMILGDIKRVLGVCTEFNVGLELEKTQK